MAGFMDFVNNIGDFIPGGTGALPSWLASMMTPRPTTNVNDASPYAAAAGANANAGNAFNTGLANNFNTQYMPAAISFNNNAQGIGGQADLAAAADRNAANFQNAYGQQQAQQEFDMTGVNPNSGAAMARRGALEASYAPGIVDAMNKGRVERETYGNTLRAQALPFLATTPNYGSVGSMYGQAASTTGALGLIQNQLYRQQVGDTTKALKLPGDAADNTARIQAQQDQIKSMLARFSPGTPQMNGSAAPGFDYAAAGDTAPKAGGDTGDQFSWNGDT